MESQRLARLARAAKQSIEDYARDAVLMKMASTTPELFAVVDLPEDPTAVMTNNQGTLYQRLWKTAYERFLDSRHPDRLPNDEHVHQQAFAELCKHVEDQEAVNEGRFGAMRERLSRIEEVVGRMRALTNKLDHENSLRRPIR